MPTPFRRNTAPRRLLLTTALTLAFIGPAPAGAASVSWVDWYALTPQGVLGTLRLGNENVQVSFSGTYSAAFTGSLPEPYWGPGSTYKSTAIDNAPPNSDIIFIPGGPGDLRLSFSQVVMDPIFAIASLGLSTPDRSFGITTAMSFDRPVTVLSNGPNYYAEGVYYPFIASGNTLIGQESSGTVRLQGASNEVVWRSTQREETNGTLVGTYGFTIGVNCDSYRIGPNPLSSPGAVPAGCTGYNEASFQQQAGFDVRGTLQNRIGASWVIGDHMTVGAAGDVQNGGTLVVGEGKSLHVGGRLVNSGAVEVRGLLSIDGPRSFNYASTITLKGDNTGAQGGRMEVSAGKHFFNSGTVTLEEGTTLTVGGSFENASGQVLVPSMNARLDVLAGGSLTTSGRVTVRHGSLLNRGQLLVQNGGELVIDRGPISFDNQLQALDNQGLLRVESGGLLRLAGDTDPGASLGSASDARNSAAGRLEVDGDLHVSAALTNAGTVQISGAGQMRLQGPSASFAQLTGGRLTADGRLSLSGGAGMSLAGSSQVGEQMSIAAQSTLTVKAGGTLDFTPLPASLQSGLLNEGTVRNLGTVRMLAGAEGTSAEHTNLGQIDNQGTWRLAPGVLLDHQGSMTNGGRFTIDAGAVMLVGAGAGGSIVQSPAGVLVNNGNIVGAVLFLNGGRLTGSGSFSSPGTVTFEGIDFEPGESDLHVQRRLGPTLGLQATSAATAVAGFRTGTMDFGGDLILDARSVVRLKLSENDGNDLLRVAGSLNLGGARLQLVFADDRAPGLDQVFTFLDAGQADPSTFELPTPQGLRRDDYVFDSTRYAVAYAPEDAYALGAHQLDAAFSFIGLTQQVYVADTITRPETQLLNLGLLGIRNLPGVVLSLQGLTNAASGQLLNSGQVDLAAQLTNQGVVKNRNGGELRVAGLLDNQAGAVFENRGLLVSTGQVVNQGRMHILGELRDESRLAGSGQPTVLNDGGELVVAGVLRGQGMYQQRGAGALTRVDGLLKSARVEIQQGRLQGSGTIDTALLQLGFDTDLAPGNSIGQLQLTGDLEMQDAHLEIEVSSDTSFDRLVVGGNVHLVGSLQLRLVGGYLPQTHTSWEFLSVGGAVYAGLFWTVEVETATGFVLVADANGFYDPRGLLPAGGHFSFSGTGMALDVTAVPEPQPWMLLAGGLLAVGAFKRRVGRR